MRAWTRGLEYETTATPSYQLATWVFWVKRMTSRPTDRCVQQATDGMLQAEPPQGNMSLCRYIAEEKNLLETRVRARRVRILSLERCELRCRTECVDGDFGDRRRPGFTACRDLGAEAPGDVIGFSSQLKGARLPLDPGRAGY